MRSPRRRSVLAGAALGSAALLATGSAQVLPTDATVLASGPVLGAEPSDTWVPSSPDRSLEPVVLAAVAKAGGVDLADGSTCPAERLALSWADPGPGWRSGGFIAPLGPAPTLRTPAVNGVVVCAGSRHAYVGFDAVRDATGWDVELVPDPFGGVDEEPGTNSPDTSPPPAATATTLRGRSRGPAIEGYARYQGQELCDPTAKAGTVALRDLLLSRYDSTSSLGISRPCAVGGRSEHKEGRAFDWGADLQDAAERAGAEDFLARLLATDADGNRHALARRMGIMYVIWDHKIWSAYRADAGWRSYSGSSPHTDHVHVSLSWAGARGLTSFWSGDVVEGFVSAPTGGGAAGSTTRATATRSSSGGTTVARPTPGSGTTTTRSGGTTSGTTTSRTSSSPSPAPSPRPSPSPTSGSPVLEPIEDAILDPLFPGG